MFREPSLHRLDPASGKLTGGTGRYEKRLADLDGLYADAGAFARARDLGGDQVVYQVEEFRPSDGHGDLIFGTTVMDPGLIGGEFFMTRGHLHARANRPEVYRGESGEGLMLMESLEGEVRTLQFRQRDVVYVPPFWIHRSVNIGSVPLVMSFYYPSDAGQDYGVIERSGGMAVRIVADSQQWKAIPNPTYRPRDADDIARLLATAD